MKKPYINIKFLIFRVKGKMYMYTIIKRANTIEELQNMYAIILLNSKGVMCSKKSMGTILYMLNQSENNIFKGTYKKICEATQCAPTSLSMIIKLLTEKGKMILF